MNMLHRKISTTLAQKLTFNPLYQAYIHLQDHDKKINPVANRLHLSYMDPKKRAADVPANAPYNARLRKSAELELRKRLFQQYKEKILQGKVDQEEVVEADQLWGDREIPVHYYRNLSNSEVAKVSGSIYQDIKHHQHNLITPYLESSLKTTSLSQASQPNQYAQLAAYYRHNNIQTRENYYQIQKLIGNKFHLLSNKSLILLKYAFNSSPKTCTPEFNKIVNDLLGEALGTMEVEDLVHLMYFNRFDNFRMHDRNLQIRVLQAVSRKFGEFSLEQKIDFLFLYVDSRGPTIRKQSHNRFYNEIRTRAQEIIYHLNIEGDFSALSELSILKLTYCLVRAKTNMTQHLTDSICEYIEANVDKIDPQNLLLFFIYLNKIQSNKSIQNLSLLSTLKQHLLTHWQSYSSYNKIRALDAMLNQNLYDEATHQLYTQIPIEADSSLLGHICRIEMMNSSGREWEVVHKLVELDYLPLGHFQDYKRFCNYVSVTAPDWKLDPLLSKLENTEIFYDALRYESLSRDKAIYRGIREFEDFSGQKALPKPFKIGTAIKNTEFAEFSLPQYQICLDIITDVQKIKGTRDLKGSYQAKIKSLECLGWKQLYVFQEDIANLSPLQFFDYIYSVCEPHFQQQLQVIKSYEQYRSYQIEQMRTIKGKAFLKMRELEQYMVIQDFSQIEQERDIISKDITETQEVTDASAEQEMKEKLKAASGGGPTGF